VLTRSVLKVCWIVYKGRIGVNPFVETISVSTLSRRQSDYIDWDQGRDGYVDSLTTYVPIQKPAKKASSPRYLLSIPAEERLGS
jgi:hypothetical protein